RYPYGEVIYEIPAGKRDKNEEPLLCGKRELKEETGATAETYISLGQLYPSPGYCGEIIWLFGAKGITFGENNPDDDEFVECERIPFETALSMVLSGEIKDAKTQTAILKVNELRRRQEF
ncbi:MAG: NUDIX hydrolase, partial [Clostridia bacterium]|nr:NUDIX hydrolase [Clostridia bacterium]